MSTSVGKFQSGICRRKSYTFKNLIDIAKRSFEKLTPIILLNWWAPLNPANSVLNVILLDKICAEILIHN